MDADTQILLVRHGHTAGNSGGGQVMAGQVPIPLTAEGRRQAAALASILGNLPVTSVYSSPLRRAADTASAIARGRSIRHLDDLMELDCGEVDGLSVEEVACRWPELWEANLAQRDDTFRWPGGESYVELRRRALRAMNLVAVENPGGRAIVITHAGIISQVIGAIRGVRPARWSEWRPGNGSISELRWGQEARDLRRFDVRDHL